MTAFRRAALIIPALLIALPAAVFNLASNPSIDLASAPACPAPSYAGATATVTCSAIGGQQTWTVPPAITSANFAAYGAHGGNLFAGTGGGGGEAVATIAVSPGDTLTIVVGGAGFQGYPGGSGAGGFNGGANNGGGAYNGGGGGGASDVRFPGTDLASRILVAGGGGGGSNFSTVGGAGGDVTGTGGASALPGAGYGTGGGPGTQIGGGAGGSAGSCCGAGGIAGSLGLGGAGGYASSGSGGGGGGGGYYGGGGAGNNSAGGGGSGFGPAGTTFSTGVQSGNGLVVITYTRIASSVTLTSSQNPSVFGQSTTFSATVSAAGGTPTGIVTFLDGGTSIGTGTLAGGVATLSTSSLAVAGHTITVAYGGDTSFNTATGSLTGTPQVVNKGSTSSIVTTPVTTAVWGQSVTFTAAVSAVAPGAGTPTGSVTFLDGGRSIGSGALSGGSATFTTSGLVMGGNVITTSYGGDGNFTGSIGSLTTYSLSVLTDFSTISVTSSANPQSYGGSVTFTATAGAAAPGSGTPTGLVYFFDESGVIGIRSLVGGSTTVTTSTLTVGDHPIVASYIGDTHFLPSTIGTMTGSPEVITLGGPAMTLSSSQNPSVFAQSVTFTATISGAGSTPTGTVTFLDGGTAIGTNTLSGGVASLTTSTLDVGNHVITASYSGDSSYNGDTAALTGTPQVVDKSATSIDVASSVNPSVYGQSVTFVAIVGATAPGSGTPTGTVTFLDGGTLIGTAILSGGVARFPISTLTPGSHTITASYGGDNDFATSTGAQGDNPQVVDLADTSSYLNASENPSVFGQPVTFTATVVVVSPGDGAPTGIVTFLDGGSAIGTGSLSGGVATLSTSALAVGSQTITVSYSGDANFNASDGALAGNPQVVNPAATTTSVSSTSPSEVGQAVTFTATTTVTAPGAGSLTGSFAFTNDGSAMTGCATVAPGVGTCVITETSAGMHTVTATYSGDDNFAGSTGSTTQSVDGALTTTVLAAVPATGVVGGQNVTFTATVSVTAPGIGTPTGLVTFADGSTVLGAATLVSGGGGDQAAFTTAFGAGGHSITATYAGDADFNNSTSLPVEFAVTVGAATVTLTSSPNPAVAGETVTLHARVVPTAPSTQAPSGSVRFYDGTTLLGTVALSAGSATFSTSFAAGSHNLSVVYSGNGAYPSAASLLMSDVEAVTAVSVPTTGANASSIVQLGALLMLTGLAWSGAAIRRRRLSRRALR